MWKRARKTFDSRHIFRLSIFFLLRMRVYLNNVAFALTCFFLLYIKFFRVFMNICAKLWYGIMRHWFFVVVTKPKMGIDWISEHFCVAQYFIKKMSFTNWQSNKFSVSIHACTLISLFHSNCFTKEQKSR